MGNCLVPAGDPNAKTQVDRVMSRNNIQSHISDFPDEVIAHVLSLLPLTDAVRTSVLSKHWKYKWASIQSLSISDEPIKTASFVNFVDNILIRSQNIQSFSLECQHMHDSVTLKRWLSSLSNHKGIKSINIIAPLCEGSTLPSWLFDAASLTSLVLSFPFTFKVPTKDFFRNLTKLCLFNFHFEKDDLTNNDQLMLTFPVLVELQLSSPTWGSNIKVVHIYSPSLTCFLYASIKPPPNDFLFKLCGANLQLFIIIGDVLLDDFDLEASSISTVLISRVDASPRSDHPLVGSTRSSTRLSVKDFSGLRMLRLCGRLTETYAQLMPGHCLPRFDMLQSLELDMCGNIEALLEILHMVPTLKDLFFAPHIKEGHFSEDFDFEGVGSVPSCMSSHLRKICFLKFSATACELHLVTFMLKNCLKLEELRVQTVDEPLIEKNIIRGLLFVYPKGSTTRVSVVVI